MLPFDYRVLERVVERAARERVVVMEAFKMVDEIFLGTHFHPLIMNCRKSPARLVVLFELQSRIVMDFSIPFLFVVKEQSKVTFFRLD